MEIRTVSYRKWVHDCLLKMFELHLWNVHCILCKIITSAFLSWSIIVILKTESNSVKTIGRSIKMKFIVVISTYFFRLNVFLYFINKTCSIEKALVVVLKWNTRGWTTVTNTFTILLLLIYNTKCHFYIW